MPYDKNENLPQNVKNVLPEGGQTIYREAFNNAWDFYHDPEKRRTDETRETVAQKVAWQAVKQSYKKEDDGWVKK